MPDILDIENLTVTYPSRRLGKPGFTAVSDVSFSLTEGRTVAIVGESGSGKTTIGRAVLGLAPATQGRIRFEGRDIANVIGRRRREIARDVQVIFQDPIGSLNPSRKVNSTILEPLLVRRSLSREEAKARVADLLARVNLPADAGERFPGQFSGGQRQRIAIARALAVNPRLVICDEPTSALDVSTQSKVLTLLRELQLELGLSYVFISHDLAVVREFSDEVLVMQKGRIVERGTARRICDDPQDPYTRRLISAAPVPDPVVQTERRRERMRLAAAGA